MSEFVPEEALDYEEIYKRGGDNYGDEDFALIKCPSCDRIYLMDYEVDTVYLDPDNLASRLWPTSSVMICVECSERFPDYPWLGPKAPVELKVAWELLESSPWSWIASRSHSQGD